MVIMSDTGQPHEMNSKIPDSWLPSSISDTELAVILYPEKEVELGTQTYVGGPPITRYRFKMDVIVREAYSGRILWEATIKGAEPEPFPETAPAGQTRLDGQRIEGEFVETWLINWLQCRVGPDCMAMAEYTEDVTSMAYSPDGQILAMAASDSESDEMAVYSVKVADWSLIQKFSTNAGSLMSVAYSPEGAYVAASTGPERTVLLWDAVEGTILKTINTNAKYAGNISFSPDGKILATTADKTIKIWGIPDGSIIRTLERSGGTAVGMAFSQDGNRVVTFGYSDVLLWDKYGRNFLYAVEGVGPSGAAFSPDGKELAVSNNGIVGIISESDGSLLRKFGDPYFYTSIAYSPDGKKLAAGTFDGSVFLWRIADGALLGKITGHIREVDELAFSPDGQVLATQSYQTLILWRISSLE